MPPNQALTALPELRSPLLQENHVRVAILGCGMMGQEHMSYISGYPNLRIDYLCDPHEPSLAKSVKVLDEFYGVGKLERLPLAMLDESELLSKAESIDLLVIASPNYLHTPTLEKWGAFEHLTILVEKPVAVSREQHDLLSALETKARIWVAMEYRYIPAVTKLISLLPDIGDIKMVTIRENRYPFLHKIGEWNRDIEKTGDTLVEKCCHFFDLFRLITGQEVTEKQKIKSMVQRGLNYHDEDRSEEVPIIDSAYVVMPFTGQQETAVKTIGCLELCMFAEGSRHQEEIIVTGTKGRLEAYLPENKVFHYQRPDHFQWKDRSEPPPLNSVIAKEYDCSVEVDGIPTHAGYHYSSTSVEWFHLLQAMRTYGIKGTWEPHVSLADGLAAVELGLNATTAIVDED